jgi:hypothetical protein
VRVERLLARAGGGGWVRLALERVQQLGELVDRAAWQAVAARQLAERFP